MSSQFNNRPQITGTSDISVDDAIARALGIARTTYGEPDWFDVGMARGFVNNGRVTHYQVTLDLGYADGAATGAGSAENAYFDRACAGRSQAGVRHTIEMRF